MSYEVGSKDAGVDIQDIKGSDTKQTLSSYLVIVRVGLVFNECLLNLEM